VRGWVAFVRFLPGLCAAFGGTAARAEPAPACEGVVRAARVTGCRIERCREAGFLDAILALADLRPGTPLDPQKAAAGRSRVLETGFFRSVEMHCDRTADGLVVDLEVSPVVRLRRV